LELFREIIEINIKLATKLKEPADIENEYKNFIVLLLEATKTATPIIDPKNPTNNIPLRIKKKKNNSRKEKSKINLAKTYTPENKSKYNQISNRLKT
jgi:hypothetical protein